MGDFITNLLKDISKHKKIQKNSKLFIKHKNIKKFAFNRSINKLDVDDLPIECSLGNSYLIKNNTIIEIYSWCDYAHSMYIQINSFRPTWLAKMNIINVENGDPDNIEYILDGCNVFYSPNCLQYEILQFILSGFILYI